MAEIFACDDEEPGILTQSVKLTLEKAFKVLLVAAQMKNCLKYFAEQYWTSAWDDCIDFEEL